MLTLPAAIVALLVPFAPLFDRRTWRKTQVLLVGAVLAPGKRTVTAALRILGLSHDASFACYHHVLNRAAWSSRQVAHGLLQLLLQHLDHGEDPLLFGLDDTVERRRGDRIAAKGIYRDPVRSSKSHFVKTSGLRWLCCMWLTPIPWAQRVWALPCLTVLAPSERYYHQRGKPPKKLTDWARQMILQLRRWLPHRSLVIVADSTYAVLALLHFCQALPSPVTMITRLRLDAALYEPAPPRLPGQTGRPRRKGARLPSLAHRLHDPVTSWERVTIPWYHGTCRTLDIASATAVWYHAGLPTVPLRWVLIRDPEGAFEPQALLCTDVHVAPGQVVAWFVQRWRLEVTFQEARKHLGVETQRQWSDQAIARTTPALLGLFSWVTLAAHLLRREHELPIQAAAWYHKSLPTFADALALVRECLWPAVPSFLTSHAKPDVVKVPKPLFRHLVESLAYVT